MVWNFEDYRTNVVAISDSGDVLTYGELEIAQRKLKEHIGERCLIFLFSSNSIGSLVGYTTCLNDRIVPLLLSKNLDLELTHKMIDIYKPKFIWVPESMVEQFDKYEVKYHDFRYVLLRTNLPAQFPVYTELALLLTTSGSTGSPKLVRQSYKNIEENTKSIIEYLEINESERPITTLPMYYTYGLSIINTHLYVGATLLLTERTLMEKEFWGFFKEHEATSIAGVPYTYEMLDKLRFFGMDLKSLRTMTQAGGKLSPETHRKFATYAEENGKKFVVMYGQTEATARMSYLPSGKSTEKCGSIGISIPGGKLYLNDPNANEIIEPYVTGELVFEGPNVTLGFAQCGEDLIKEDENCGILSTGDMAYKDEDGYYFIVGRKKRFVKIFGNRTNMDEIELLIHTNFRELECACVGEDDKLYIFITIESLADDVKRFISKKTGLNPIAFKIKAINNMPKNEAGKILYTSLEKYYD